jgi:hypothetical protein
MGTARNGGSGASAACAGIRLALGVYVLGAADPAERAAVRMHLARCRDCREELVGLAGLPGLLGRVPATEAAKLASGQAPGDGDAAALPGSALPGSALPGSALPGLLARAVHVRRARRWLAGAAAVLALAAGAGGGFAGASALGAASSSVAWTTVSAGSALSPASAAVRYAPAAWGTDLEVRVAGLPAGTVCQLLVLGPGGRHRAAGGWTIAAGQYDAWYPASTSFPASGLRGFAVIAGGRTVIAVPVRSPAR